MLSSSQSFNKLLTKINWDALSWQFLRVGLLSLTARDGTLGEDICQDEILLNTVLETCTRHRETKRLESMLCLFEKSKLRPSTPTYGSIIKAYGTLRCPEKCWAYWREMIDQRGLKPTHIVIGCMLDALVSNGLVDDAERLFAEYDSSPPNMVLQRFCSKSW